MCLVDGDSIDVIGDDRLCDDVGGVGVCSYVISPKMKKLKSSVISSFLHLSL